jgi:queuosine precursor transporter
MNIFNNTESKVQFCLSVYISAILVVNLAGAKTVTVYDFTFSTALFVFPVIGVIQDAVTEVFGRQKSRQFLYFALICSFLTAMFLGFSAMLPPSQRYVQDNAAYTMIFGQSIRILLGSLTAFFVSDMIDIWIFEKLRKFTKGKYLLLRTNVSNVISQTTDTFLFTFLAFYAVSPKYTLEFVFTIALSYLGIKLIWSFINSPFVNLLVYWLRREYITVIDLDN